MKKYIKIFQYQCIKNKFLELYVTDLYNIDITKECVIFLLRHRTNEQVEIEEKYFLSCYLN